MKLISSREAVTFLSQAAPRPWVQRLLRWMAFDEGLSVYSRKGRVQPYVSVASYTRELVQKAGEFSGQKMDQAIREEYSEEIAERLVGKDPYSRYNEDPYVWDESEEPKILDFGFFLFASEIDWDDGILRTEFNPSSEQLDIFFSDSEFLGTELDDAEFEVEIEGLSFELSKIEMLLPSMQLGQTIGFTASQLDKRKSVGRPQMWDWEGAMAYVISLAQHPDGLPTGPGAQARIEGLISEWFMQEAQDTPSPSQVRQRAAKIIQMIETPKTL